MKTKHGTLAQFHQLAGESLMSALDEGLMATLTQEERDAMQAADDAEATSNELMPDSSDQATHVSEELPNPSISAAPAPEGHDADAKSGDESPKTLAMIPGGEGPGDVDGEFADVLALEGLAYEQAIARMSSTER
jgi:hypothetical protein